MLYEVIKSVEPFEGGYIKRIHSQKWRLHRVVWDLGRQGNKKCHETGNHGDAKNILHMLQSRRIQLV